MMITNRIATLETGKDERHSELQHEIVTKKSEIKKDMSELMKKFGLLM